MNKVPSIANILNNGNVIPINYDLCIDVSFNEPWIFNGFIKISLKFNKDFNKNSFDLHTEDLNIIETIPKCIFNTDSIKKITTFSFDNLQSHIVNDMLCIEIKYTGTHNDQMCGFYRSRIQEDIILSTQFEAIDARRCFPCIDEPSAKAKFNLSLIIPHDKTALSNMPIKQIEQISETKHKVSFEETPMMSTYLVAFAVGSFQYIEGYTSDNIKVRVYTHNTYPNKCETGRFALDTAIKCIELYNDMFGIKYPLNKVDMIAIPEFATGAMENWGLITYREVDLLINENSSADHKQRVAIVVCHELAHQWFGNLVTMAWWNDLWLNEGFASWMEVYSTDKIYPEFHLWDQYVNDTFETALSLDSLDNSHPISVNIHNAEEVEEVFDAISYNKGSCVINMIYNYIGHDAFQKGLQNYMYKYKYSNTTTNDLWNEWKETSGEPIDIIMNNWIYQKGFPLLTIDLISHDSNLIKVQLSQKPFNKKDTTSIWNIPLNISSKKFILNKESDTFYDITTEEFSYIINKNCSIPLRINYNQYLNQALTESNNNIINTTYLINNSFSLFKYGLINYGSLKNILTQFKTNKHAIIWDSLFSIISFLHDIELESQESFNNFIIDLIEEISNDPRISFYDNEHDSHLDKLLKSIIINLICTYNYNKYTDIINELFNKYLQNQKSLSNDIKVSVLRSALSNCNKDNINNYYNSLINIAKNTTDISEKNYIYRSIGFIPTKEYKESTLEFAMTEVPIQDFSYVFSSVAISPSSELYNSKQIVFNYFVNNFNKITTRISDTSFSIMSSIISASCGQFTTEQDLNSVKSFLESSNISIHLEGSKRFIKQMYEKTENIINIKKLNE